MDGHGPRNQTGIARNTSRKDGIRAGAVSGPWRSEPVADRPRPPAHEAGHGQVEATQDTFEPAEPIDTHAPGVVRRPPVERRRSGPGIAIALGAATLLAGAAWWLTGTERWQALAPTTVEEEGWIGDLAGGDLDALTEEELAAAERAWIERTTPGATGTAPAPPATAETDGTTGDDAVGTNAAVAQPPALATQDAAAEAPPAALETVPAVPAEVAEPPEPPPVPAPSLIRSGGFPAGGTLPLGQDGVADVAGPGLSISPTRIGPMPRSSRPPAFRLPDSVEDLPPSLGRIVAWVAG
jgi:hypothetical protein